MGGRNHGYGANFALDCSNIATLVAGTRFAFPPEKIKLLASYVLDGSQWMARGSASDYAAEGREITRPGQTAGYLGTAARNMLKLPTGREKEFEALAERVEGTGPALEGNRHFWRSDLMTHQRKGYYTSVHIYSKRLANTDAPCNGEGIKNHHIADGANVLFRTGKEYRDIFPVWDWQKVPGTTVVQTPARASFACSARNSSSAAIRHRMIASMLPRSHAPAHQCIHAPMLPCSHLSRHFFEW